MINFSLVKGVHKFTSPITTDVNQELKLLWLADITRPWHTVYSREQSRPSYDFGIHRSYFEEAKKSGMRSLRYADRISPCMGGR